MNILTKNRLLTKSDKPAGWKQLKFADVISKIQGGGTPSKIEPNYWNGNVPWASVKDIVTHNPNDTKDHISELGLKNSSSRLVPKGTLIVPTRMALGHAVFFNVDVAINQDLKAIYPDKGLKKEYLFYWFQSKKKYIARLGSGSTVDGISQDELKNITYLLPPLPEQEKIVEVLENWDSFLEKLSREIKLKKRLKKVLMQQLLREKIRLPGFSGDWIRKELGEASSINPKSNKLPSAFVYIDLESVEKGILTKERVIKLIGAPSRAQRLLEKRDILFQMVRPYQRNNLYFDKDGEYVASTGYAQIRTENDARFIYYVLHTDNFVNKVLEKCTGSNYPAINSNDLAKIEIMLPSLEEQTAIANILTRADKEIEALESKKRLIEEQKKFLLNQLITGNIRFPEFQ